MDKSNLSKEGKEILKNRGYYEEYVPFVFENKPKPSTPYNMTVDFVVPKEDLETFKRIENTREERQKYLSDKLNYLIRKGFVLDITGDMINSIEEYKEEEDNIKTVLI